MFKKIVLDNGIKVLLEKIPVTLSTATGCWVEAGSKFESESEAGYSHFIEHMLFKGTKRRSASKLAQQIDRKGAIADAATTKEYTVYYFISLYEHLDYFLDILSDIIQNPLFSNIEIEREKRVVMEEIKMIEDSPDDSLAELFLQTLFPDHPIGRPIIGNKNSIINISRKKLFNFFDKFYKRKGLVIAIAGNLNKTSVLKKLEKIKLHQKNLIEISSPVSTLNLNFKKVNIEREVQQIYAIMGFPGISLKDKLYLPMLVLNFIIGGGLSSRLFQVIRERKALCYSIFSAPLSFFDLGIFTISFSTDEKTFKKTYENILNICKMIQKNFITKKEFKYAKEQLRCKMALAAESIEFRMERLITQEKLFGRYFSVKEILEQIQKITMEDVYKASNIIFNKELSHHLATVGPKNHSKIFK